MTAARPPWRTRPSRRRPSVLPRMVRSDRTSIAPWKGSRPQDPKKMSQQKPLARGRRGTPFVTRKASTRTPGCSKVPHCKNAIVNREVEELGHANQRRGSDEGGRASCRRHKARKEVEGCMSDYLLHHETIVSCAWPSAPKHRPPTAKNPSNNAQSGKEICGTASSRCWRSWRRASAVACA